MCSEWIWDINPNLYLIERLLYFNSSLLSDLYFDGGQLDGKSLLEVATLSNTQDCPFFHQILQRLKMQVKYPMAYVIDEHHEIFAANLQLSRFFRPFTIMSGILSGVRIFNLFLLCM